MNLKWLPLACMLLAGCSDRQRSSRQNKRIRKKMRSKPIVGIDYIRQQEAKYSDIPVPLSARPIPEYFNKNDKNNVSVVMGYHAYLTQQEASLFYTLEMERLGWYQVASFDNDETLLNFEKPGHICNISIRPKKSRNNKSVDLFIFTSVREDLST